MIIAKWKTGMASLHNGADADTVAREIRSIGEDVTPKQIVNYARNEDTELHKCFEWDNNIAAERYRLFQARQVVCHLVIKEPEKDETDNKSTEKTEIRVFHKTDGNGYKPAQIVFTNADEYAKLIERAKSELVWFKRKYSKLTNEFPELFHKIDSVIA